MSTTMLLRGTALAVLLAVVLPAPASPQIGGFIKRKVKEKVVQTVVGTDSTTTASPSSGARRVVPTAKKGPGPVFNEYTLEITPEVLAKLEKGLAAEAADRKAAAQELAKILSHDDYEQCQVRVSRTPEGQKAYHEFTAKLQGNDQQAMSQASQDFARRLEELGRPQCGPGGSEAEDLRRDLHNRPEKTGLAASGLTEYQYQILKERIVPFCSLPQPPAAVASGETRIPPAEAYSQNVFYVYAPGEVTALQGRCARLMAGLALEQAPSSPTVARKPRPGSGT